MFKKQHLALAIAATLAAGAAQAALETSVTLKNETAYMTSDSIRTGEATTRTDTTGEGKGVYKFENTAKVFINDELANGASWHGELNIVRDTKAINDYQGHETSTQRDWLRELYVDTTVNDWDVRLGKQQVVWGTADGIKLLDMVNPTDWSEFNQNAPADARIPVWMINAEKYLDNGGNIQAIVSLAEKNKIAGLNASGDQGHPFLMKGVDTISGKVNGFYNVAPAMGKVATFFIGAAGGGTNLFDRYKGATINEFSNNGADGTNFRALCRYGNNPGTFSDAYCLKNVADDDGSVVANRGQNNDVTNLSDAATDYNGNAWSGSNGSEHDVSNPNSVFEYMDQASFATFYSFGGLTTTYRDKTAKDADSNAGFRFRNSTDTGLNYSFNYLYHYDNNPYVDIHYEDSNGNALTTYYETGTTRDVGGNLAAGTGTHTVVYLSSDGGTTPATSPTLVFTEKQQRIHSLGGSFDFALDTNESPVVIRGEFLYDKDTMTPIIDRAKLSIGDLTGALTNQKADFFKYVIGADTTVMTDMMLSGQFIQFRNLDYVDETHTPTVGGVTSQVSGARYTGDMATLSMTNGLNKAKKNKEFYSIFASKPFGESGEGRWNNIFIYEEGGGKWNRFDVEYGFDDQLIGTFEVNKYFGDNNTMFGQFENASNVQIGVKYLLQ